MFFKQVTLPEPIKRHFLKKESEMTERQRQYLSYNQDKLDALQAMWRDSRVQLYNDDKCPTRMELEQVNSVFLAGPTSRNQVLECNWRCEAVSFLHAGGFSGWIFCPEPRGQELPGDFTERSYIHEWESSRLMNSTHVAFWIPRKADELLGLNTNLELGIFLGMLIATNEQGHPTDPGLSRFDKQKLFIGWPKSAERMGLPRHYAEMADVEIYSDLSALCGSIAYTRYVPPGVFVTG